MNKIILALCLFCLVSLPCHPAPKNNLQIVVSSTLWTVSQGESLSFICSYWTRKGYGTSVSLIAKYNKLTGSTLYPGQKLEIPFTSVPPIKLP
jgi:hypothetical protein